VIAAPDYAEALDAWRVWRVVKVDGGHSLASVVQAVVWPAGEALTAECLRAAAPERLLRRLVRRPCHEAPEFDCQCGIYAGALEHVEQYLKELIGDRKGPRVLGRVALWGSVVECERGFRASHAYPQRIFVPADTRDSRGTGWQEIAVGLSHYGVPVEPIASRAEEAARVLSDREARV